MKVLSIFFLHFNVRNEEGIIIAAIYCIGELALEQCIHSSYTFSGQSFPFVVIETPNTHTQ